jgi:DNA-binding CsgD family transcriptional regulator
MGAGSTLEDRTFNEVKRLCCAGLDETTLLREMPERLRRVVPFDAHCASMFDPLSGLITRACSEGLGGSRESRTFFERLYFEDDINGYNWMTRDRRPVILLSEFSGGRLERSLRYRELTGPLGLGYELRGVSMVGRERWGGIDLTRERGHPDFDSREIAFICRIAPHLGAGLKVAALCSQSHIGPGDNGTSGILVLDHRGWILHYTAPAERWLRELEDLGPGWREGNLPVAVWTVVGALRRALKPETERDRASVPRLHVRARSGRWLTLQAARSEPHPGGRSETVIVIDPAGPREMAWFNAAAYGLSLREREIVELVMRGAATRQISTSLYITEHTVQKHLSNIFEKVGVRSRGELVMRLFFDNLYPTLVR